MTKFVQGTGALINFIVRRSKTYGSFGLIRGYVHGKVSRSLSGLVHIFKLMEATKKIVRKHVCSNLTLEKYTQSPCSRMQIRCLMLVT